jgi:hypothetical protein
MVSPISLGSLETVKVSVGNFAGSFAGNFAASFAGSFAAPSGKIAYCAIARMAGLRFSVTKKH